MPIFRVFYRLFPAALAALWLVLAPASVCAAAPDCAPLNPVAPTPTLAVSLRAVQQDARRCQQGLCNLALLRFYGLTRVDGYVLDPAQGDLILVGAAEPGAPLLHAEDLVVALRNQGRRYLVAGNRYLWPAVSIDMPPATLVRLRGIADALDASNDPVGRDARLADWLATCSGAQAVRVEGVPRASRFARVMVDADYLLKQIADDSLPLPGLGLPSLMARNLEAALAAASDPSAPDALPGLTRLWFQPGVTSYRHDGEALLLERTDVRLLDEAQHLGESGAVSAAAAPNPLAQDFACDLSRRFPEVAATLPLYRELWNLFRWVALARLLDEQQALARSGIDLGFLLDDYRLPASAPAPARLPGIGRVLHHDEVRAEGGGTRRLELRMPSCGGVLMAYDDDSLMALPDPNRSVAALRQRVLASRPAATAAVWPLAAARAPASPLNLPTLLNARPHRLPAP